jgi:site-specific recombinase XerD
MIGSLPAAYWPENLMKRGIRPAAKRAKIMKHISWHTFRRTFSTLLKANGEDIKTVQELLRHANSRITPTFTPRPSRRPNVLLKPRLSR